MTIFIVKSTHQLAAERGHFIWMKIHFLFAHIVLILAFIHEGLHENSFQKNFCVPYQTNN